LQNAFRRGFDLIAAKDQPMGFIHTLYYYQVEKSIEDAKKEEMRIAKEKQQQAINARMNRRQQLMGRRPVNNSTAVNNSYSDSANIDAEDLEDAFGI
jgi:hypothetical protein